MTKIALSNALNMLKLEPDAFMVEVSRAISPKPWHHSLRERSPKTPEERCSRCDARRGVRLGFAYEMIGVDTPWMSKLTREDTEYCPVPPTITDPPEVVSRKLRDKANISMVRRAIRECGFTQDSTNDSAVHALDYWYAYDATPYEQIACCLVALGKWQVKEKP